jgi:hypothetical protein
MPANVRRRGFDWSSVPLHPVMVAAFPVLFLFAENAEEQVTLAPLWQPLLVCVAGGLATLLVMGAMLRDWRRGALLASLLLALFFSFGHAWQLLGGDLGARWGLAAGWFALAIVGGVLIWRGGSWVVPTGRFLNAASIALVAFNVFGVASYASSSAAVAASGAAAPNTLPLQAPANPPDVYYIILDRYAGVDTLRDVYGFDNEPFLRELEKRGFTVARRAWANYYKTFLSVYSSLSMDAIRKEDLGESKAPYNSKSLHAALRGHLTLPASLKAIGYDYIHLASWPEPTSQNVDADVTLRFQDSTEFSGALASTTFLSVFSPPAVEAGIAGDQETTSVELARDSTLYTFDRLAETVERPGPNYVFAHILVPHPPYIFDADGTFLTQEFVQSRPETVNYVDQLEFANRRVITVIDRLLSDPTDPVIVLQSDEGPRPERFVEEGTRFDWLSATDEEISQKFGILNAIHLPGGIDPRDYGFTDRTSPVNNFRIVFNAVFGANLPLREDMTYLSPDAAHMYDFVPYPPRN